MEKRVGGNAEDNYVNCPGRVSRGHDNNDKSDVKKIKGKKTADKSSLKDFPRKLYYIPGSLLLERYSRTELGVIANALDGAAQVYTHLMPRRRINYTRNLLFYVFTRRRRFTIDCVCVYVCVCPGIKVS